MSLGRIVGCAFGIGLTIVLVLTSNINGLQSMLVGFAFGYACSDMGGHIEENRPVKQALSAKPTRSS